MNLNDLIKKNKPELSNSSTKTYITLLNSLCKKMNVEPTMQHFMDTKTILPFIKDNYKTINTRKTILTALYVLTLCPEYKDSFLVDCETVRKNDLQNEMNPKQMKNWIPYNSIVELWSSKKNTGCIDQDLILLSLITGVYIPPRRLLDWAELKHRNYDFDKDNYIDFINSSLVFNKYKTFKKYGKQTIPIPKDLLELLRNYITKYCLNTDYVLSNVNGDKMSTSVLNSRINKIFGDKKVGCNIIRHSYISEKVLPFLPKLSELHTIAYQMGHSISTQMIYKKDSNVFNLSSDSDSNSE